MIKRNELGVHGIPDNVAHSFGCCRAPTGVWSLKSARVRSISFSLTPDSRLQTPDSYSVRSAAIGSTLAAREAGTQDARSAAPQSNNVAMLSMRGSDGETPKS